MIEVISKLSPNLRAFGPNLRIAFAWLFLGWLLLPTPAANAGVEHDLQIWTPITLDIPIKRKLRGYFEVGPRVGDDASRIRQLLIRPGLEYRFNDHFSLFTGYLWQSTYQYNPSQVLHEHRTWQQILLEKNIKRLSLINRSRLEQRYFEDLSGTGNRLRHLVKGNFRLSKLFYLTTSNELFLNLNSVKDGPQRGIDQNRLFTGIGFKFGKNDRIEFGYQYQYVNRSDEFDDLANHALVFQTYLGLLD
ncbi:MAG: DUF2490 domain-containing protein [Bdellovibrionales bacterium]|nr:DUF2490 domain-containing protein [Bdellovibrionales bacterium]